MLATRTAPSARNYNSKHTCKVASLRLGMSHIPQSALLRTFWAAVNHTQASKRLGGEAARGLVTSNMSLGANIFLQIACQSRLWPARRSNHAQSRMSASPLKLDT